MYMDLNLGRPVLHVVESTPTEEEDQEDQSLAHRREAAAGVLAAAGVAVEREHMFEKVVTPSDVGKLNRLVVPKQHAERFFPAAAAAAGTATQLCFEDRAGTAWRFRYSYWGSSQSYVITKGWSRFLRAARLAAGDTVSFSRSRFPGDGHQYRYFIDYRHCHRRGGAVRDIDFAAAAANAMSPAAAAAWPLFGRLQTAPTCSYGHTVAPPVDVAGGHRRVEVGPTGQRSFRLFGVNVECGGDGEVAAAEEEEEDDDDGDGGGDRRGEEMELVMWTNP